MRENKQIRLITSVRDLTKSSESVRLFVHELDCAKSFQAIFMKPCRIINPAVKAPILSDACIRVRIKYFLQFHDLWTLLNKIREGVALSPLSILHKTD